jgi:hypothetical protein
VRESGNETIDSISKFRQVVEDQGDFAIGIRASAIAGHPIRGGLAKHLEPVPVAPFIQETGLLVEEIFGVSAVHKRHLGGTPLKTSARWNNPEGLQPLRLTDIAHQISPSSIERALRCFVSYVTGDNATVPNDLALDSPGQLQPFGTFDAEPFGAAIEHFDVIGSATTRGAIEGFVRAEPGDV